MIQIDIFEKVVTALAAGDRVSALRLLENEINNAKERNRNLQVKRLRSLLPIIAGSSQGLSASTVAAPQPTYRYTERIQQNRENQLFSLQQPSTNLTDVVLSSDNEDLIHRLMSEWKNIDELNKHDLSPINRVLLYGPPGTGKTMLAGAIANELDFPLMIVHLDELISSYLGKTGKNIREIFQFASQNNVVLFLDEVDTIAKHRDDQQDSGELKRVVTVFLQNLDMLPSNSLVIGATNHEDLLDKAIWRRFPFRMRLDPLKQKYRQKLIMELVYKYSTDINTQLIASLTDGMNGSAIKELINDAARNAIINHEQLKTEDLVRSLLLHSNASTKQGIRTHWGETMYSAANILFDSGFSLRDLEKLSGIPYTTLRGRIGK